MAKVFLIPAALTRMIVCCKFTLSKAKGLFNLLFAAQQGLTLLSLSKKEGRCCITNPSFITTITCPAYAGSTSYLYPSFSGIPINIGIVEKRGLCSDGLLFWRRSGGGLFRCAVAPLREPNSKQQ
jgi:hypothetical protein